MAAFISWRGRDEQSFIQLNNYIENGDNEEFKNIWDGYIDEIIDGDLTGRNDKTRRDYYMDMFGRLRDRLANPERGVGDFYAPTNRAGTANQDFGFAYSANKAMELLGETENSSYEPNDEKQYTDMIDYKYGEMADEKSGSRMRILLDLNTVYRMAAGQVITVRSL